MDTGNTAHVDVNGLGLGVVVDGVFTELSPDTCRSATAFSLPVCDGVQPDRVPI